MCQKFEYLEMTVTNQNCIHEEIKSRLNSGDSCYRSGQSSLSSVSRLIQTKLKFYLLFCAGMKLGVSH